MITVSGVLSCFNNPKANPSLSYTPTMKNIISVEHAKGAVDDFSYWPDYRATPLHDLSGLAETCGIDKLWYKDESKRFELKSFKALGGALLSLALDIFLQLFSQRICPTQSFKTL